MSSAESVTSGRAASRTSQSRSVTARTRGTGQNQHRQWNAPDGLRPIIAPPIFAGCPLVDSRETQRAVRRARCAKAYRLASTNATLLKTMTPLWLSLTRTTSLREQSCNVCGADFVPAEDAGSRLLSLMPADREPFSVLMCGGCHSRWSHGVTVSARTVSEASLSPVLRQPPPVA